jgi:RHS repeat-associated protein
VEYAYDLAGKVQQLSDPTGTYSFAYDNMGRLIGTTTHYAFLPGLNFQNAYTYDAASNRTSLMAPDNSITTYGYDTLNRLNGMANSWAGSFGFGYDALSRRTSLTRPNGVNTSYSYDSVSHLMSVLHQAGNTVLDGASYTYDPTGNRTSKTNYLDGVTSNYGYDLLYQLTQVTQGGSTTESYSYDAVGNRLSSLAVPSYTYNLSNELTSNSNGSYTYDNNGNTLTDAQGRSFTWDFENRLVQTTNPSVGTSTFKYDPFGRRIQKSGPLGTTTYIYDGANILDEVDNTGSMLARYAQGPGVDQPLSAFRSGSASYHEVDGIGSITSLTNDLGVTVATYAYDAYGNLSGSTGSVTDSFRYTGREFDLESGSYYYRARYYDPQLGRFISEDPVRFGGGSVNFYAYAHDDPVDNYDPTGMKTDVVVWAPVGWGESSQGHVSVVINGTSYSWGPANGGTMYISPADEYERLNTYFRPGTGYTIALTPDQEADLAAYLTGYKTNPPKYGPIRNNCLRPIASWLRAHGYAEAFALDLTPKDLVQTLKRIPNFVTNKFYIPGPAGGGNAF